MLTNTEARAIESYLTAAAHDYLAARTLFLHNHLKSACELACVAIEKQLKANLSAYEVDLKNSGHNAYKLLEMFIQAKQKQIPEISLEFFEVITQIYEARYFEQLKEGFNFVILRNKFLTELDHTMCVLDKFLKTSREGFNQPPSSCLDGHVRRKNAQLLRLNHAFGKLDKDEILSNLN